MTTPAQVLRQLQEKVKSYQDTHGKKVCLVDALISQRRLEASSE